MKYILNETPLRTNNGYKINDLMLDLNIPKVDNFSSFKSNIDDIKYSISKYFSSKINLNFDKCYKVDIDFFKEYNMPIILEYDFDKEKILVNEININSKYNNDIVIKYKSNYEVFNNVKININVINSKLNVTIINLLNEESSNFLSIESNVNNSSDLNINFIDLGAKNKVSNIYSVLNEKSNYSLNDIYLGLKNDRIDMNFYEANKGVESKGTITSEGALLDNSIKSFKGTIDFLKGSTKSVGEENENCVLLSDTCKSLSLPMLLCHEDDVIGSHGVSSGKIDEEKLFYLMSRGINEKDAKRLIVLSNFNKIIDLISSKDIKEEILNYINDKL